MKLITKNNKAISIFTKKGFFLKKNLSSFFTFRKILKKSKALLNSKKKYNKVIWKPKHDTLLLKNNLINESLNYISTQNNPKLILETKEFNHLNVSNFLTTFVFKEKMLKTTLPLQKQNLFFIKDLVTSLNIAISDTFVTQSPLISKKSQVLVNLSTNAFTARKRLLNIYFWNLTLSNKFEIKKKENTVFNSYFILIAKNLTDIWFTHAINSLQRKSQNNIFENKNIATFLLIQKAYTKKSKTISKNNFIIQKAYTSLLQNRASNFIFKRSLVNRMNSQKFFGRKRQFLFKNVMSNKALFSSRGLYSRDTRLSTLRLLEKIEQKILSLENNKNVSKESLNKVLILKGLCYSIWKNKREETKKTKMILAAQSEMQKIRRQGWKALFFRSFLTILKSKKKPKGLFQVWRNFKKVSTVVSRKKRTKGSKKRNKFFNLVKWQKPLKVRATLTRKKLSLENKALRISQTKELLSTLIKKDVNIFFINSLALTKFAFKLENNNRSPNIFLNNIDREMINRYKYVAIYIKDLIRISFISLFMKNPTFLAKFVAFQLSKLPRNRKETKFIRFTTKVIKIFTAQRKEMLGMRIKFKGRVNRWRRTKSITAERGTIPLHTYDNRIEYGSAFAINRKGTLGIRIWFRYKPTFQYELKNSILKYMQYSKWIHLKKVKRGLLHFTKKK